MDPKEILRFAVERGLLIEPEVLNLFKDSGDAESVKMIIEKLKSHTQTRIITKTLFEQNKERVSEFFFTLPQENQKSLERMKIKLGLEIEISKEVSREKISEEPKSEQKISFSQVNFLNKKVEVDDFVKTYRSRFSELKSILQDHVELEGLVSINKLSKGKRVSIIGMVADKRVTKNKNIIFEVEDVTGRVKVLINQNKPDLYKIAEEISLDSVIGFSGFGDREIFFANNLVFPDAVLFDKKKSPIDESVVFISDLQYGSKLFLKEQFNKFVEYLGENGPEEARKIKYLFLVGDLVSGVGVYPGQQKDLEIVDIEEQYKKFAEILKQVRKDIKIIISPGNHDGVRLMEPQPSLDEKYAWPIYSLPNVAMTGNPSYVNIGATDHFSGFDILLYHGFSYPYYANNIPSLISADALNNPEKIMTYLLRNRHLAPAFSSTQTYPMEKDELVIKKVPDIFVSGHLHKCAISSYNNILLIANSSWEAETENQKKRGNKPDFCKVPLFNLKTRAIKILDFEGN